MWQSVSGLAINRKFDIIINSHRDVAFGKMVADVVLEFETLALSRGKAMGANIDTDIVYRGDEALLRRLVGILPDNAVL